MPKQNEIILRSADTVRHFVADWNNRIPGSIATYELKGKAKAWHVTITAAQGCKLIVIAPLAALLPLSAESADTLLRGTHKLCIG